jgi:predicted nuclease of predicted toxin-antitoxin system
VKLLFDENLSYRLVSKLRDEYPDSRHVRDVGLRGADDDRVWIHARSEQFVVVSKDTDFRERSFVRGAPPKVVWLDVGNSGTDAIAELLKTERVRVERFALDGDTALLILSLSQNAV